MQVYNEDMKSISKSALLSMIFISNLTLGSKGADVADLQQFLVSKSFLTMPAGVPYGYFGALTQKALAQWQISSGISPAVGYFGPISQKAFATQTSSVATPVVPSVLPSAQPDTSAAPGMRVNRVMLFRAFPYEVRPGDSLVLDGSGFSRTLNKVYFNGDNALDATSTDGTTMKISVPANLTEGEYKLSISNVLGSSDPDIKVLLKVTNSPQPAPTIESASIVGDTVMLIGNGFTATNNLFTTFGNSSNSVSSNGTTLSFRLPDLSWYDKIKKSLLGRLYQATLWIYVQNEHGINENPYKLETII